MWAARGGGPPDEEWIRRMNPPENEIPVALPLNTVLARTDDVAVALLGLQVYSLGVAFDLVVRLRPTATQPHDLHDAMWGSRRGGPPGRRFLLGVELADGRRATSLDMPVPSTDVVFHKCGGGGGSHRVQQSWWLSPLPPEGHLRLVLRCPDLGVEERSTELDGTAIRHAAAGVVTLWPWASAQPETPGPQALPDLPPDSWFAR